MSEAPVNVVQIGTCGHILVQSLYDDPQELFTMKTLGLRLFRSCANDSFGGTSTLQVGIARCLLPRLWHLQLM